jgi:hypothetical protein
MPMKLDIYPSMAGVPALPGGVADQYYQQEMGWGYRMSGIRVFK